ncbi:hypothetical protein D6821_01435, partial [Candidatus Parcubacteria bacterium]
MDFNFYSLLTLAVLVVNFLFLRFVLSQARKTKFLLSYILAVWSLVIWQMVELVSSLGVAVGWLPFLWRVADSAVTFLMVFLLFFVLMMIAPKLSKYVYMLVGLSGLAMLALIWGNAYIIGVQPYFYGGWRPIYGPLGHWQIIWIVAMGIILVFSLMWWFWRGRQSALTAGGRYLAIGLSLAVSIAIIFDLILPLFGIEIIPISGLASTLAVGSFLAEVYKFHFLDIRLRRFLIAQKLLLFFVLIVAISASSVAYFAFKEGVNIIKEHILAQLESVAFLKENQLRGYLEREIKEMQSDIVRADYIVDYLTNFHPEEQKEQEESKEQGHWHKNPPPEERRQSDQYEEEEEEAAEEEIRGVLQNELLYKNLEEVFIITPDGKVDISTDPKQEGKFKNNEWYFQAGQKRAVSQGLFYDISIRRPSIVIAAPLKDSAGRTVGVYAGRLDPRKVNKLMLEQLGLGKSGETYLVARNNYAVSDLKEADNSNFIQLIFTKGIEQCLRHQNIRGSFKNYQGVQSIGVYRWIPSLNVCLVAEMEEWEALLPVKRLKNKILIVVGLILL